MRDRRKGDVVCALGSFLQEFAAALLVAYNAQSEQSASGTWVHESASALKADLICAFCLCFRYFDHSRQLPCGALDSREEGTLIEMGLDVICTAAGMMHRLTENGSMFLCLAWS